MADPKPLVTDAERAALKTRTAQLIDLVGGGEFFAFDAGVKKAQLSKYGSHAEPDAVIRLDVAVALDRRLGSPEIIGHAAALLGYRLTPIAEPEGERVLPATALASVAAEGADVVATTARAMADGAIDPHERRQIHREIDENIVALQRLRGGV